MIYNNKDVIPLFGNNVWTSIMSIHNYVCTAICMDIFEWSQGYCTGLLSSTQLTKKPSEKHSLIISKQSLKKKLKIWNFLKSKY